MKANVKARLKNYDNQRLYAAHEIMFGQAYLEYAPMYIKRKSTEKAFIKAVLVDFDRLVTKEFYGNEDKTVSALYNFDRVIKHYRLEKSIDFEKYKKELMMPDPKMRKIWMGMLVFLTISYYNVADDYLKNEKKQRELIQKIVDSFIAKVHTAMLNCNYDTQLMCNIACKQGGFEVIV